MIRFSLSHHQSNLVICEMTVLSFVTPNISSGSFYNLAVFICHLFSDGRFQSGNILYDPTIFDTTLISEIQLKCPQSISWQITDITRPFPQLWQPNQDTDRILQLVFFNPAKIPRDVDDITEIYTFYRVFVFFTVNRTTLRNQITILNDFTVVQNYNFLIVGYYRLNGSIWIHRSLNDPSEEEEVEIGSKDGYSFIQKNNKLFDPVFGGKQGSWLAMIKYGVGFPCHSCREKQIFSIWNSNQFLAKFFISNLNGSYVNRTYYYYENSTMTWEHEIILHKNRKIYEELNADQNQVDSEAM